MYVITINRQEHNFHYGTFGSLLIDGRLFCTTLELPNKLNKRNESSIPAGMYFCDRFSSDSHPDTFQVMNVPERSGILFHAGNTVDDTAGCILLGSKPGKLHSGRGVLNSGETFRMFMNVLDTIDRIKLVIREVY